MNRHRISREHPARRTDAINRVSTIPVPRRHPVKIMMLVIFALFLGASFAATPAYAATGTISVGTTLFTDFNANRSGTGWTWAGSSATLTLNSAYTGQSISFVCDADCDVRIIYSGNVSATSVYCNGNLTIGGSGGTLSLSYTGSSYCLYARELTVNSGTVNASSTVTGATAAAIYASENINIGGTASVTANVTGADAGGIVSESGDINISTSGTVTANGNGTGYVMGTLNATSGNQVNVSNGTVKLTGANISKDFWHITGGTVNANVTVGTNPLYRVTLDGMNAGADVTDIYAPVGDHFYNMKTNSTGKLCFWLPAGSQTVMLKAGEDIYTGTFTVASNHANTATMGIFSAPTITTTTLPARIVGVAYSQQLAADGGIPITWSIYEGTTLPAGLSLSPEGLISGTPTTAETANFTVEASNVAGNDTKELTIQTTTDITADFIDPNFLAAVRTVLGKGASEPIYAVDVALVTSLNVSNSSIARLAGVEHFVALQELFCGNNSLTTLPANLPANLQKIYCQNNWLTELPATLPANLQELDCHNNSLIALPATLPATLQYLSCNNNSLTALPALPANLLSLDCGNNSLTALPATLPANLQQLSCGYNSLTALPANLSANLQRLYCDNNSLTELPANLPANLRRLYCNNNQLIALPPLPSGVNYLDCNNNRLTALDVSGATSIDELDCRYNYMTATSDVTGISVTWDVSPYYFTPQNPAGFKAVINIADLPRRATIGTPLTLAGTVIPSDADNKTITWTIHNDSYGTGAVIFGANSDIFSATSPGRVSLRATITDGLSSGADYIMYFDINVAPTPPTISTTTLPDGIVGVTYSRTLEVNGAGTMTWSVTAGSLPAGLTLNSATGVISGTPTVTGTANFTVKVSNGALPDATQELSITIIAASSTANFSVSNNTTKYETLKQAIEAVAEGGTMTMLQDVTGGVTALARVKTYTIDLNGKTLGSTGTYSLYMHDGTVTLKNGTVTTRIYVVAYSQLIIESGTYSGDHYAISSMGGEVKIISGTFFRTDHNTYSHSCLFNNGGLMSLACGSTASPANWADDGVNFVTVTAGTCTTPPTITTSFLPNGRAGSTYSSTLEATGAGATPITWSITDGSLPAGLTLNAVTGEISGRATTAETAIFTVEASNGVLPDATRQLSITIAAAIPNFSVSNSATNYETLADAAFAVADGGTITMLQNVTLSDSPDVRAYEAKTYTIDLNGYTLGSSALFYAMDVRLGRVTVKNGAVTKDILVYDNGELTVESGTYSGINFAIRCESGKVTIISGTFSSSSDIRNGCLADGNFGGQIFIADGSVVSPATDWKNVGSVTSVTVTTAPTITTSALPNGTAGTAYSRTLAATGGGTMTWSVSDGSLPDGLTLDESTGVISGTPTTVGTATFTVEASNGVLPDATQELSITVNKGTLT
ncbi:MAG: putative Ig domain-containing protein, partial [Bacteroidales bacterium]|nr:putative Ig domain-containing protein [Bacteroidales bacterium]